MVFKIGTVACSKTKHSFINGVSATSRLGLTETSFSKVETKAPPDSVEEGIPILDSIQFQLKSS
jgi:hypothetical protein